MVLLAALSQLRRLSVLLSPVIPLRRLGIPLLTVLPHYGVLRLIAVLLAFQHLLLLHARIAVP